MAYITDYLLSPADRETYQGWVRQSFRPVLDQLGWVSAPGDDSERRELRSALFRMLGYSGRDPEAIARANSLVHQYMRNPTSVDPALLDTVFQLAARNGTPALYDEFMARLGAARNQSPDVYHRYLNALALFPDPDLVKRALEHALSPEVRSQDAPFLIVAALTQNSPGRDVAWQFVRAHWAAIRDKVGLGGASRMVRAAGSFCDPNARRDVQEFFTEHKVPRAERQLRQSLELIQNCTALKTAQQPKLTSWLERQSGSAGK